MKGNVKNIVVGIILIVAIIIAILLATGTIKVNNVENQVKTEEENVVIQNVEQNNEAGNSEVKSDEANQTVSAQTKINEDDYLGYWYEDKESFDYQNPNEVKITSISDRSITFDLYITRSLKLEGVKTTLTDGKGSFKAESVYGEKPSYSGTVKIEEGQVVVEIDNQTITFKEHIKLNDYSNYVGEWFENFGSSEQANANRINVKNVSGNKIKFNFYITRIFNSPDIEVEVNDEKGTFTVSSADYKASGNIEFSGKSILLTITTSTIPELDSNQVFVFTYKK